MTKASTEQLRDFHNATEWPKGLYRRVKSFRFKRSFRNLQVSEVWGAIPEEDAIRRARRYNLDMEDGRNPVQEQKRQRTTFKEAAARWLQQKQATLNSSSLQKYKSVLDTFQEFLARVQGTAAFPLADITYAVAQDYITARQAGPIFREQRKFVREAKGGASKKTVLCDREVLRQLFGEACKRKDVEENPFSEVKVAKPSREEILRKHHPLTVDEEKALLHAIEGIVAGKSKPEPTSFLDVVVLMLKTGLREMEVRYLEWSDIQWGRGLIRVREKQIRECRRVPIPPGSYSFFKARAEKWSPTRPVFASMDEYRSAQVWLDIRADKDILSIQARQLDIENHCINFEKIFNWKPKASQGDVPMCETVASLLRRLQETKISNFVFPHDDGGACRQHWLGLLKKAQAAANISGNLRIHDLRHTCAMRLRERKVPLETIAGILRHSDLKETLIYAPYKIEEGRDAIKKLDEA